MPGHLFNVIFGKTMHIPSCTALKIHKNLKLCLKLKTKSIPNRSCNSIFRLRITKWHLRDQKNSMARKNQKTRLKYKSLLVQEYQKINKETLNAVHHPSKYTLFHEDT